MSGNQLNISFEDSRYFNFKINDYCTVFSEKYSLNKLPVVTKVSQFLYKYSFTMEAEGYDLSKVQYLFLSSDNSLSESDFSLMGNSDDFINLIISNANRTSSGWIKGQVVPSSYKNLTFTKENCYNALSRLAEEFETEFWIEGKTIHLTKRSTDTGYTFKHGRNKGLYEITRQTLNDSSIATRLYVFGAEKNLPPDYILQGKRLRLPSVAHECLITTLTCDIQSAVPGTTDYSFNWVSPTSSGITALTIQYRLTGTSDPWINNTGSITGPRTINLPNGNYEFRFRSDGGSCDGQLTAILVVTQDITVPVLSNRIPYLERNTNVFGIIEHTEIFDDTYPHRTGIVSSVDASDPFVFLDTSLDFNVNNYLLPGLVAKVVFNTGQLAGYQFEIASYDHSIKKFKVQKNAEEKVLDIPSNLLRPAIGDEYVLVDIQMPQTYVDAAEQELKTKGEARLLEISEPKLAYSVVVDTVFLKKRERTLNIGDLVWIVDDELELQRKIRIVSTTRNLIQEYQYQIELSDIVSPGTISRLISSQASTDRDVRDIDRQFQNNSILNNNVVGTLVFQNIPTTSTMTGFSNVVIEESTGKLYKKI